MTGQGERADYFVLLQHWYKQSRPYTSTLDGGNRRLVCDTGMWDADTPSITTSLRGLVYEEVRLTCADRDLHSGLFGGVARNPIHVLADVLSALHKPDGSVAIPGFYDGVRELPPDIKADLAGLDLTPEKFLGQVGLKIPAGEKDRMVIEQVSTRPTAEVNGIIGGYTGEGAKTVIPGKAMAKVSFRLVGAQDPEKIRAAFRDFVRARLPADCTVDFGNFTSAPAFDVAFDNRRSPRRAPRWRRIGARRRWPSDRAGRSRSSAISRPCSAWIR